MCQVVHVQDLYDSAEELLAEDIDLEGRADVSWAMDTALTLDDWCDEDNV